MLHRPQHKQLSLDVAGHLRGAAVAAAPAAAAVCWQVHVLEGDHGAGGPVAGAVHLRRGQSSAERWGRAAGSRRRGGWALDRLPGWLCNEQAHL